MHDLWNEVFLSAEGDGAIPGRFVSAEEHIRKIIPVDHYDYWKPESEMRSLKVAKHPPTPTRELLEGSGNLPYFIMYDGKLNGSQAPKHHLKFYYDRALDTPSRRTSERACGFQLSFPLTWLEERDEPGFAQTLFKQLCDILQPVHATSGLHLSTALSPIWLQEEGAEVFYDFLVNHPGVMHGDVMEEEFRLRFRMSTVNWLTAVHEDLLALCGGREAVLNQLSLDGYHFWDYQGGMIIQAGPSPQLGDRDAGIKIPHYGQVARALKPARIEFDGGHSIAANWRQPGKYRTASQKMKEQNEYLTRLDDM